MSLPSLRPRSSSVALIALLAVLVLALAAAPTGPAAAINEFPWQTGP